MLVKYVSFILLRSCFFFSIYLDCNATTPLANEVLGVIYTSLKEAWGNPTSSHEEGDLKIPVDLLTNFCNISKPIET